MHVEDKVQRRWTQDLSGRGTTAFFPNLFFFSRVYRLRARREQVDRAEQVPPPVMVVVMGPRGSGKTTLIRSLIKLYTGETKTKRFVLCRVSGVGLFSGQGGKVGERRGVR